MGVGGPPRKWSAISLMPSISASSIQRRGATTAPRNSNQTIRLVCPTLPSSYHAFRSVAIRLDLAI